MYARCASLVAMCEQLQTQIYHNYIRNGMDIYRRIRTGQKSIEKYLLTEYFKVLPYFKKSEKNLNMTGLSCKYHGVNGEQAVSSYPYVEAPSKMIIEGYKEIGLPPNDNNGACQLSAAHIQSTMENGIRASTNTAFIQPIRYKRKNLIVKVQSEAYEILISENNVAYGVKYVKNGKFYTVYARREVIISAGSINSPKLLMLSGIGPKKHLSKLNIRVKKDLCVGENLQDHATFNGYIIAFSNKTYSLAEPKEILDEMCDYSQAKSYYGPLAYGGLDNAVAFLKSDSSLPAPDIEIHIGGGIVKEFINELTTFDSIRTFPTYYYDSLYTRVTNLTPLSRGVLYLNASNPHGAPILYADYYKESADFVPVVKVMRVVLTLEKTKAFKSRGAYFVKKRLPACKDYPWGSDEYTICLAKQYTSSGLHPVGTCKMGPKSDKKAVVDPKLRVYGISRLRVIDSSIMPVINRGNTNAPSIMIGERGVAFIIEKWSKKY